MILHRRSQLLEWLTDNAPTASIRRAVGEGSVEFIGWFSILQGSKFPGWIVQVTSIITGIVWNVVVRVRRPIYHAWVLDEDIPWQYYNPSDSNNPFMQGDNSETYKRNREGAQAQRRPTLRQEDISS